MFYTEFKIIRAIQDISIRRNYYGSINIAITSHVCARAGVPVFGWVLVELFYNVKDQTHKFINFGCPEDDKTRLAKSISTTAGVLLLLDNSFNRLPYLNLDDLTKTIGTHYG